MTRRLMQRLSRLEGSGLAPWMQDMVTTIAREQGLDPGEVMQETKTILRQIHAADIPLTKAAVAVFLASAGPVGTAR